MKEQYNPFAAAGAKLSFKQYAERPRREPQAGDTGTIEPLKRNPFYGVPSDIARALHESTVRNPEQITGAELLSDFIGIPAIAKTLDRLSYGDRLTENTGQATRVLPETTSAVMAALPFAQAAAGATRTGRNIGRVVSGKHSPLSAASEEFARVRSPNERAARVSEKGWVGPVATGDEFGVTPPRSSRVVKGTNLVHTHPPHPSGKLNPLSAADRDTGPVHVLHANPRGALTGYYDSLMSGQPPELNQPMSQLDYVRRLMADPTFSSNTAENMYSLTGELDPSMLTGGLQALRPKGGNVNMSTWDFINSPQSADNLKKMKEYQEELELLQKQLEKADGLLERFRNKLDSGEDLTASELKTYNQNSSLKRATEEIIRDYTDSVEYLRKELLLNDWEEKNLRRYVEREHGSTDDSILKMIDRREDSNTEFIRKAAEQVRKAEKKRQDYENQWFARFEREDPLTEQEDEAYERFMNQTDPTAHDLARAQTALRAAEQDYRIMQDFASPIKKDELLNALDKSGFNEASIRASRIAGGAPEQVTSKNMLANAFENLSDAFNTTTPIEGFSEAELAQLGIPSTAKGQVFEPNLSSPFGLQMQRLPSYIRQLFEAGQISEDELARLTPAMAVERRLDEGMRKELETARRARSLVDATPEIKKYEDNSRWVSLRPKDNDQVTSRSILQNESENLHHCIGQNCYIENYLNRMGSGSHDYYSLRDPSGAPKVTFEVKAPLYRSKERFSELSPEKQKEVQTLHGHRADIFEGEGPYIYTRNDGSYNVVGPKDYDVPSHDFELSPEVMQIKAHGNTPPSEHYQEKITDFLTMLNPKYIHESSRHHRMIPIQEALTDSERAAAKALDIQLQRFVSPVRRDEIRREIGSPETSAPSSDSGSKFTFDPDIPDPDIGLFD